MSVAIYGCVLGLLIGGVYALMASGLALVWGVMRVLNIAQAAAVVLGAYLSHTAFVRFGIDPMLSILFLGPIMFLIGVASYYAFLRPIKKDRETLTVLVTYALAIGIEGTLGAAYSTTLTITSPFYSRDSFQVFGNHVPVTYLFAFLVSLVILGGLGAVLKWTRFGRSLRAATQNPQAAQLLGVQTHRTFALGFGIGTATAAAAGALFGMIYSFNPASHLELIGVLLAIVVLGGFGSMGGAVVAALILGVISSVTGVYSPLWSGLTFYGILVVVLLFRPQGLWGLQERGAA